MIKGRNRYSDGGTINLHPPPLSSPSLLLSAQMNGGNVSERVSGAVLGLCLVTDGLLCAAHIKALLKPD